MKRSSVAILGVLTARKIETGLPARPSDVALIGRRIG
jgi:hypothetical protein